MMAVEKYKEQLTKSTDTKSTKMYDAILMDFMMPVCDGPTATKVSIYWRFISYCY
jgi:CheY-like chemotaxis protein